MKVSVQAGNQSMEIVCGHGNQTIRWLALVASQRLKLMQPKGRQRMREAGDARRGFALPHTVLLKDHGSLNDPEASIKETIEDGAELEVLLMEEVEVDDVGAPVITDWFLKAFGVGEATKRRLNGAQLREKYEAKIASDNLLLPAWSRDNGGNAGTFACGNRAGFDVVVEGVAISGPLETAGEIRAALEQDWRSAGIGGLVDDPKDAQAVKALLQVHLPALNELHALRSGGRLIGGSAPAMSFHDFMHVMHRYGAMPCTEACDPAEESDGNARVRQVFDKAREAHWSGSSNTLSRAQFLAGLVLAARTKEESILEAVTYLLEQVLLPSHAAAIADEAGVEVNRPEVQRYISDNRRLLHAVYLMYAQPSEDGALISLEQFRELLDDCGVMSAMTATSGGKHRFDSLAETCFFQVQGTPPLHSLVFTECMEASCRVAIARTDDGSSNHNQRHGASAEGKRPDTRQNELEAIYLVLDCIIDLGLGDRGLQGRK